MLLCYLQIIEILYGEVKINDVLFMSDTIYSIGALENNSVSFSSAKNFIIFS